MSGALSGRKDRPHLLASGVRAADGGADERGNGMAPRRSQHRRGQRDSGSGSSVVYMAGKFPPGDASLSVLTGDKFVCAEAVDGSVSP